MKHPVLIVVAVACVLLLFVPHNRDASSFKPKTLVGIYVDAIEHLPTSWNADRTFSLTLLLAGVVASLFPLALLAVDRTRRATFVAGGLAAAAGALANALLILLNQTTFAFGGRPLPREAIFFAAVVGVSQLAFASLGIAIGASVRLAARLRSWGETR